MMKSKINITKREGRIIAIAVITGLFLGWLFFHGTGKSGHKAGEEINEHKRQENKETVWTCSMHPQIRMDKPGKCPICAMDLIPVEITDGDDMAVSPDEIQMTEAAMKIADILTMTVRKRIPDKKIFMLGRVKADERKISEITARFGGRIEKLYISFTGQDVSKGQKMATIYSPALVTAQKELLEALEYKQSNPEFYNAARNKLILWDLTDEQIDNIENKGEIQHYFDVLAPVSGTVTMRHVAPGDYVREGSALFQVTDLSHLWILFEAYESDLPWIKTGDRVDFTIQSLPGKTYRAGVTFIDPVIDPQTRIARVRAEINNKGLLLKPEMFVNGIIYSETAENRKELLIPKTAILWTGKRSIVYVRVPNNTQPSFVYREIKLGPEAGAFYVVKAGLNEGEEIAVNGVFKIDAAAQLAGKPSMMNPGGNKISTGHNHGEMNIYSKTAHNENPGITEQASLITDYPELRKEVIIEQANFKVAGNCEMCKERIEEAAIKIGGVNSADWNMETKTIDVSFDRNKIKLIDIHKAIANAGHDTDLEAAPEDVYNKLPECCQYKRNQ